MTPRGLRPGELVRACGKLVDAGHQRAATAVLDWALGGPLLPSEQAG